VRPAPIYLATPTLAPPGLPSWRTEDERLGQVKEALGVVGLLDPGALVLWPLGLLSAPSEEAAYRLAEEVRTWARSCEVSTIFGVDLVPPQQELRISAPPTPDRDAAPGVDSLCFTVDAARPHCGPARRVRPTRRYGAPPLPDEDRLVVAGGHRLGLLLGGELFHGALRSQVLAARPEAFVVLSHVGPSHRWGSALTLLEAAGPVLVTGAQRLVQAGSRRRGAVPLRATRQPSAWLTEAHGTVGDISLTSVTPRINEVHRGAPRDALRCAS
jgi:hypothetical protein